MNEIKIKEYKEKIQKELAFAEIQEMYRQILSEKHVYLYTEEKEFIQKFENTQECADFFNKDREYIYYNLNRYKRIRKDGKWYIISRTEL